MDVFLCFSRFGFSTSIISFCPNVSEFISEKRLEAVPDQTLGFQGTFNTQLPLLEKLSLTQYQCKKTSKKVILIIVDDVEM